MATVTRQPFAPLDGVRLQALTSLKNRQNAVATASPVKRKASDVADTDDFENVDPIAFSKRSKGNDSSSPAKDFIKPAAFVLKSVSTGSTVGPSKIAATAAAATPRPRSYLQPKSPAAKLNIGIAKSSPLSAPAGRSPTRGKRAGILSSRRRTAGPYTRVDPPVFGLGSSVSSSAAPFSLDAALKGTIPSYTGRHASSTVSKSSGRSAGPSDLLQSEMKSDWFFDIHEDTPEQEMTNLLQHSTCVLDISSDEESETRRERERAEGKENVPPMDDISQTSRPRAARHVASSDDMVIEKERNPLGEMNVCDYYAEGCDETSVIMVPGDEGEGEGEGEGGEAQHATNEFKFSPEIRLDPQEQPTPAQAMVEDGSKSIEELMEKTEEPAPAAALLQPIEGSGDSFDVWESGSAKDETEMIPEC